MRPWWQFSTIGCFSIIQGIENSYLNLFSWIGETPKALHPPRIASDFWVLGLHFCHSLSCFLNNHACFFPSLLLHVMSNPNIFTMIAVACPPITAFLNPYRRPAQALAGEPVAPIPPRGTPSTAGPAAGVPDQLRACTAISGGAGHATTASQGVGSGGSTDRRYAQFPPSSPGQATPQSEDGADMDMEESSEAESSEDELDPLDKKKSKAVKMRPELERSWVPLLDFDNESKKKSFGPKCSAQIQKWGSEKASSFRPLKADPCLHSLFQKAKSKDKTTMTLLSNVASASGASAHAAIAARSAAKETASELDAINKRLANESTTPSVEEMSQMIHSLSEKIKNDVVNPLTDNVKMQAHLYGKAVTATRQNILAGAESTAKTVLSEAQPADGYYFGNPSESLHSTMTFDYMNAQIRSSSSFRGSAKRGGVQPAFKKRTPLNTTATTTASSSFQNKQASSSKRSFLAKKRGGKSGK